ncbi:MAG: GAF domain-containing protein [Anaerolineales bacterium]|nr:GAF domain-containing protein [Anaerolineales bacterium]
MKQLPPSLPRKQFLIYGVLFAALVSMRLLILPTAWQGTLARHVLMEFTAALLALFVGMLSLARLVARRETVFLFISSGFLGAGLLDAYHVLVVNPALALNLPPAIHQPPDWNWSASPTFLSILIFGSWLTWRREVETGWHGRMNTRRLFLLILSLTAVNVLLFALVPLLTPAPTLLARIALFISATFFLWSLVGYLAKGHWQHNAFEQWLLAALLISFCSQSLFLPFSQQLFDALFETAHLLKLTSYLFVLVGLLASMVSIFRRAERSAVQLQEANAALQLEIDERRRAQTAEYTQRQLAEALRDAGTALAATLDLDALLDELLSQIAAVLPYDTANVMRLTGAQVQFVCTRGYSPAVAADLLHATHAVTDMPGVQHMLHTGQPLVIPDTAVSPLWVHADRSPHVRSWAGTPITSQQEVVAFLALNHNQTGFYQPADAHRLAAFAGQAAIAMQNARLYQEVQKRVAELTSLHAISQVVTSSLNLQTTLAMITGRTTRLLDVAAASLVLHDPQRGDLWFAAASGEAADFVRGRRLPLGHGVIGWVVENGQPLLVADAQQDTRHYADFDAASGFTARTLLCVPLQYKGRTIGAIEALNKAGGQFDDSDQRLLTLLAGPAAVAIENARLYEQAQQEIQERMRAEAALAAERESLAQRVAARTADLSAANAELAKAARLKDEFLASMSHELRTPLHTVLGVSEALLEAVYGEMNADQRRALHMIEDSGRHLLALISDILDLSKIEAGKLDLTIRAVSVHDICDASLRFVRQEARKKQLQVSQHVDPAISTLSADDRRLKQILVNLLSNAVKFTPVGGQIGLEVTADADANLIHFAVWDTGIGIERAQIGQLFRPFVQLDSRLAREYSGTGLGLSLVHRMTELHGGGVRVDSEVGQGSRFTVTLPWRQSPRETAVSATPTTPSANGRPPAADARHILLVEDNEAIITGLCDYLQTQGHRITVARNGLEALDEVRRARPDLILMDIQMPRMDGLEVTRRMRADPAVADVPIVAITALAMPGDRERCLAAGANAYLSKPIRLAELAHLIRAHAAADAFLPKNHE